MSGSFCHALMVFRQGRQDQLHLHSKGVAWIRAETQSVLRGLHSASRELAWCFVRKMSLKGLNCMSGYNTKADTRNE